jgi:16S rRNA processing protein RimM
MHIDDCFNLGYIQKAHGVHGEIIAVMDVDHPENYQKLESVFIEINNKQLVPFFIERISIQKERAIIKFEEVDSLPQAEELISANLFLPLSQLPELGEKQFYYHEITGFLVEDKNLGPLGDIQNVYTLPQQDLVAMSYKGKEVLFPINDQTIVGINKVDKILTVELPEGLLEVYLDE